MAKCYGMAPEKNYSWEGMLKKYVEFKKKNGRRPSCKYQAWEKQTKAQKEEIRLYYWMMNQNRLVRKGQLSTEHMVMLVEDAEVDIPNFGGYEEIFLKKCEACAKSFPTSKDPYYSWLASFQKKQKRERSRIGSMLP